MRILGLIPARGGSKAVPGKNIRPLCGRSLVARAYDVAAASGALDRIILSTDDPAIVAHGRETGVEVPFMRPETFASDTSPMLDVVLHALDALAEMDGYAPDAVLLLQPTSPLRTVEHIRKAIRLLEDHDSVCSVVALPQDLSPYYLMKITASGYLDFFMDDGARFTRRQDLPIAYRREGTIFLTRRDVLVEQKSFYGKRCCPMMIDPACVLNIDTLDDWAEAEQRLESL
ncbi:MAG: cytidylyltransferase domain-containing protein [Kiritimatiellia bacterium]